VNDCKMKMMNPTKKGQEEKLKTERENTEESKRK
jgi:hypothetical protein